MRNGRNAFGRNDGTIGDLEQHFGLARGEGNILLAMFAQHTMQAALEVAEELGPIGQMMIMNPEIGPSMLTEITSGAIDEALRGEVNEATLFLNEIARLIKRQR